VVGTRAFVPPRSTVAPTCIHTPKRANQATAGHPARTAKITVAAATRTPAARTRRLAASAVAGAAADARLAVSAATASSATTASAPKSP
jgi:hypothetical protein